MNTDQYTVGTIRNEVVHEINYYSLYSCVHNNLFYKMRSTMSKIRENRVFVWIKK